MAKRKPRRTTTQRTAALGVAAAPAAQTPPKRLDLAAEYHYVLSDLRQIALIAAGLIAGLVILSFFI